MRDFTCKVYVKLLEALRGVGYSFQTVAQFVESPAPKSVVLRHDIDISANAALKLAILDERIGIKATYYFRMRAYCFVPIIIEQIVQLGHEVGYHYEDLSTHNGNMDKALVSFKQNIEKFNKVYAVQTICMHGRSGSPYDNRDMWRQNDFREYGIIAEPYLSVDFNKVLYLTDVTQRWNGSKDSIRDNVVSKYEFNFKSTLDIIANVHKLPNHIMLTIHPELWTDNILRWVGIKVFVFTHNNYKKYYRNKRIVNGKH